MGFPQHGSIQRSCGRSEASAAGRRRQRRSITCRRCASVPSCKHTPLQASSTRQEASRRHDQRSHSAGASVSDPCRAAAPILQLLPKAVRAMHQSDHSAAAAAQGGRRRRHPCAAWARPPRRLTFPPSLRARLFSCTALWARLLSLWRQAQMAPQRSSRWTSGEGWSGYGKRPCHHSCCSSCGPWLLFSWLHCTPVPFAKPACLCTAAMNRRCGPRSRSCPPMTASRSGWRCSDAAAC